MSGRYPFGRESSQGNKSLSHCKVMYRVDLQSKEKVEANKFGSAIILNRRKMERERERWSREREREREER